MKSWHCNGDSSSSSNLSAFAPPFTAIPFSSNPNSNPYEHLIGFPSNSSLGSWLSPDPHFSAPNWSPSLTGRDFNVINYPSEHGYVNQAVVPTAMRTFPYGQFSDSSRANVDEVRPYHPQYFYSRHEPDYPSGLTNQPGFDGLSDVKNQMVSRLECPDHVGKSWGDAAKREQDGLMKLEEGHCTEQRNAADYYNYTNQGTGVHPSTGFSICGEASNGVNLLDMGKLDCPKLQQSVEVKSLANYPEYTSMTSLTTLNLKHPPVLQVTHSEALSLNPFSSLSKDQMGHSSINQNCMGQCGSSPGDRNSVDVFPSLPTKPAASSPIFEVCSGNHGNGSAIGEHCSSNDLCNVKETHAAEISEGNILLDEAQIMLGQGRNSFSFGKLKDEDWQNEKVIPNNASICPIKGNTVHEISYMDGYGTNVSSFEAFNHFSHTADSPYWKGVPIGHCSPSLGPSNIVPAKHLLEFKEYDGVNPQKQVSQNADFALKVSSERLNEAMQQGENQPSERNLMFHQEQPCVFNLSTAGQSFHDAMHAGSSHIRQQSAHFNELTNDCSLGPSQVQQNSSKHKVNPGERKLSGNEGVDKEGNISDDSNNGLFDVSFKCVEHVLSSPPITEPAKHSKCYREELTPKIDVSMVVRMMHNLSEMLMFCSSNGAYDLKEQDCEFLKNATNSLIALCLENRHLANEGNSKERRITFVPDRVFLGEFPGVDATLVEVKRPEIIGEMHNSQGKQFLIPPFVGGEKKHLMGPNYCEKTGSGTPVVIGQSNVRRDDRMTQSGVVEGPKVSNILGKPEDLNNYEKLNSAPDQPCESSSDLSSLGVLPDNIRDDKMTQAIKTILAENFDEEEEAEPQVQLFKNLWLEAEAALCSMNYRTRYDRLKFEMKNYGSHSGKDPSKKTIAAQGLSNSEVFANLSTENKSADDASKNHDNLDISVQSCSKVNDVMTRLEILKDRDRKSNLGSNFHCEEMTSPKVSCSLRDEFASETFKSPAIPTPMVSTVKGSTHEAEHMQSSIFSRLSILKQREENLSSIVNLESDLSQDVSGRRFVGLENRAEASVMCDLLSISKQREDHLSSSEMEAKEPLKAVNLESSVLSRLSILQDENSSAMEWNRASTNVVNLESVLQKDYFTPISEKADTPKGLSSGLFSYHVPESQMTGSSKIPMTTLIRDFSSSSDWEHVLEEEEEA